jgi:Family of unknown function (DUF5850)
MSDDKKNQNLLLGCAALVGVLAVCGGMYYINQDTCENEYDSDDNEYEYKRQHYNRIPEMTSECYGCGDSSMSSTPTPMPEKYVPPANYSTENYNGGQTSNANVVVQSESYELPASEHYASPLSFSAMAGGYPKENYVDNHAGNSDYLELGGYSEGSQNIPVYDEKSGQIGLPVPDMTDISAGENNKYVYDRTIGTIGFTSTKINGRRRGVADFIRGDLPIIPDQNPSFSVSADPNVLQVGFMDAGAEEYASRYQAGQRAMDPNKDPNATIYDSPGDSGSLSTVVSQNLATSNAGGANRAAMSSAARAKLRKQEENKVAKEVLGPNANAAQLSLVGGTKKNVSIATLKNEYMKKQMRYNAKNGI